VAAQLHPQWVGDRCPHSNYQHAPLSAAHFELQNDAENAACGPKLKRPRKKYRNTRCAIRAGGDEQGSHGDLQPRGINPRGGCFQMFLANAGVVRFEHGAALRHRVRTRLAVDHGPLFERSLHVLPV